MKSLLNKWSTKENILLATIWGAVIITGFLALGAIVWGAEGLVVFGRVHSLVVRLGLVYTAVHVYRHKEQIVSRFGTKISRSRQAEKMGIECQSPRNNRTIKVITAIAFHIVLHIISVHLAVAYTVYHIVQHRHDISALFKKLSLKHRGNRSQSLQLAQVAA